jgi:hypothetical protein
VKIFATAALAAVLAAAATAASATELLTNGDFEAGNAGFYSDYQYMVLDGTQHNLWGEGTYDVSANPNLDHSLFSSFGDHTSGQGQMMVINGSPTKDAIIWSEGDVGGGAPLIGEANTSYTFSFWLASVYPASPADLQLWVNGAKVDGETFQAVNDTGLWQHFTYSGVTGATGLQSISLSNLNTDLNGNDFALDDMHLNGTAVPEPASWALMLVGFGGLGSLLRMQRRQKMVPVRVSAGRA